MTTKQRTRPARITRPTRRPKLADIIKICVAFTLIYALLTTWKTLPVHSLSVHNLAARYHQLDLSLSLYRLTGLALTDLERDLKHLQTHYSLNLTTDLTPDNYKSSWLDADSGQLSRNTKVVLITDANDFARCVRAVIPAIQRYAPALMRQHLSSVYCLDDLTLGSTAAGGTYDSAQRSVYLIIKDSDASLSSSAWLKEVFHHEFSSLLMKAHGFDEGAWRQAAGLAFRYEQDEDISFRWMLFRGYIDPVEDSVLFNRGLLRHYSETGVENDFNTYAQTIFVQPETMRTLIAQYPIIARKYQLFKDFYLGIDPGLAPVFAAIEG